MVTLSLGLPVLLLLSGLGLRILHRARAARATTDALVGIYFLCMGIGGGPALLANDPGIVPPDLAAWSMASGHAVLSFGFGALYVFVWRCFGPDSGWRRALALAGCAACAALWVAQGVVERFEPPGGAIVRATAVVRAGALVWALGESLRYGQLMRRRVRLELADPLVANRFLLWSLWMGAMLGAIGIAITVRFAVPGYGPGAPMLLRAAVVATVSLLCVLASGSLWLAFFPPGWYARRIAPGAAAA